MDISNTIKSGIATLRKFLPSPKGAGSVVGLIGAFSVIAIVVVLLIGSAIALGAAYGTAVLLVNVWVLGILWKWFIFPHVGYQISALFLAGIWIVLVALRSMLRVALKEPEKMKAKEKSEIVVEDGEVKIKKPSKVGKIAEAAFRPFVAALGSLLFGYLYTLILPYFF